VRLISVLAPILGACVFAGCASRPPVAEGIFLQAEQVSQKLVMPIGSTLTREIGEPMYESGVISTEVTRIARLDGPAEAEMDQGFRLSLPVGAQKVLSRRSAGDLPAMCAIAGGTGGAAMVLTGGGNVSACLVDTDKNGDFDVAMFERYERYFKLKAAAPYTVVAENKRELDTRGQFRRQLIYQGLAGGVVRVTYREFVRDMARDAFTQELSYELRQDGTAEAGFRGLRMRILSASNSGITYVIDKPMD
jgi:hypothetical protein